MVCPYQFLKCTKYTDFSIISWIGLLVGLIITSIIDSRVHNNKEEVQSHWMTALLTLSVTSIFLFFLCLYHRKNLSWTIILTISNLTWSSSAVTAFYRTGINWIFLITILAGIYSLTQVQSRQPYFGSLKQQKQNQYQQ